MRQGCRRLFRWRTSTVLTALSVIFPNLFCSRTPGLACWGLFLYHGSRDDPGGIGVGREHLRDIGDSNDGRQASAEPNERIIVSTFSRKIVAKLLSSRSSVG